MNTQLIAPTDTADEPNLALMKRADLPAVWSYFREKVETLKATALTLTVTSESDKPGMKLARQTRLNLREIRISVEKFRKESGEEALRQVQDINSGAKALREAIEVLEARMLDCEEFAERAEAARSAEKLRTRTAEILALRGDPNVYKLDCCSDEAFAEIVASLAAAEKARADAVEKARAKAEVARLAAAAAAEKTRIEAEERATAERVEHERVRVENERLAEEMRVLREEADAREKKARAERVEAAAELARVTELARKEAAERQKAIDEADAKLAATAAQKKQEEEAAAAAERASLAAPDKKKLETLAQAIRDVALPEVTTDAAKDVVDTVRAKLAFVIEFLTAVKSKL